MKVVKKKKIEFRCNKKSSLSRKKLNIGITKIKVASGKIEIRYNKNQGCLDKKF